MGKDFTVKAWGIRVHLLKDVLAFFSFHQFDGCPYEQIYCSCSDSKAIRTTGWKSHLVVKSNGAKQEQVPLNSKESFVPILGHHAVASHGGYLLLLLGVWNVYYTEAGNPQTY